MTIDAVDAVILDGAQANAAKLTADALATQSWPLRQVVKVGPRDPVVHRGAGWLWLLEAGVVPQADALEHLIFSLERFRGEPPPALAVSRVLDRDGKLDRHALPVPEGGRRLDAVVRALEGGDVAVKTARPGSMLVRADALRRAGRLSARQAAQHDLEWTARICATTPGLLAPSSVAVRAVPRPPRAMSVARAVSLARFISLVDASERPWFLWHLAEQALADWAERGRPEPRGLRESGDHPGPKAPWPYGGGAGTPRTPSQTPRRTAMALARLRRRRT